MCYTQVYVTTYQYRYRRYNMKYPRKAIYTIAALMALQSGVALAAEIDKTMEIPKSGSVNRLGTVSRVIDDKSFVLRDQMSDNAVDVHTDQAHNLKQGQRVRVTGTAQSEALGIGHEIVKAAVVPL